jgi:putative ABC transport system permease protein
VKSAETKPPQLAQKVLASFLREDLAEEVLGDLDEAFAARVRETSLRRAKLYYYYQVINYCRPFAIRKARSIYFSDISMFRNYFKTGFRNILRNKFFSLINISGMGVSLACFLLISLFIIDEMKFDRHVAEVDTKYRVYNEHFEDNGNTKNLAMVPPKFGPTLDAEYPEVEGYTRLLYISTPVLFNVGDQKITEREGGYADSSVFHMFDLHLTEGNAQKALTQINEVAISQSLKNKYFPGKNAVGETISISDSPYKIVAVFQDFSKHSHLQLNYFLSIQDLYRDLPKRMESWGWSQFHTYIKLKKGTNENDFEIKLKDFAERNAPKESPGYYIPHIMRMRDIHLYATGQLWDISVRGNIQTIYILVACAIFILVISILNFVNLSTARAMTRFKEVGIRKVVGAIRGQLINQFISESVLVSAFALVISIGLIILALPFLNAFTEKNISLSFLYQPLFVGGIVAFTIFMGIAAGAYPAFFISRQKPVSILGKGSLPSGKTALRHGLVIVQFFLSFFLIIASTVVSDQHTFMRNTDIGFEKENIIVLPLKGDMTKNSEAVKQAFSNHSNVMSASLGYGLPGEAFAGDAIVDQQTKKEHHISLLTIDHDYVKTLGLELIAGRDFSKDRPADSLDAFIISESTAKMLGYKDAKDALNHPLEWPRWDAPDSMKVGTVIGVIKDIQLNSMRDQITPVVLQIFPYAYTSLSLKVGNQDMASTIAHLETTWKRFNSAWPFEYRFLDENFDRMYKAEEKLAILFNFFTSLTIFVASLGLFGLVVYSTSQRHKEISIRKVLGATGGQIVVQLTKSFVLLILIAFSIAIPFSYFAAKEWLQEFVFHISLSPWLFIKAGALIMAIAFITVMLQSLYAANSNPVNALKEQ